MTDSKREYMKLIWARLDWQSRPPSPLPAAAHFSEKAEGFWAIYQPVFEGRAPLTIELIKAAEKIDPSFKRAAVDHAILKRLTDDNEQR